MIVGANLTIGAIGVAFYIASVDCAVRAADGICAQGYFEAFMNLMLSGKGIVFWIVLIIGIALFWHGRYVRKRS